jgi:hypothetical protein
LYTLADVTRITGAKRRSVQLWAEAGVIKADLATERAGAGVHRSFDRNEVIIACVVNGVAVQGVPIGKLLKLSSNLRYALLTAIDRESVIKIFNDALNRKERNIVFFNLQCQVHIWSSKHSETPLREFLISILSSPNISAVCVDLNACLAGASFIIEPSQR